MTALLDLFRAYPGGVQGLARESGVGLYTLYRVANVEHARIPSGALSSVSAALQGRVLLGRRWNYPELESAWREEREKR